MYLVGVLMVVPRSLLDLNTALLPINEWIVWYSCMPIMAGVIFALADLALLSCQATVCACSVRLLLDRRITVALTAYIDEQSIGAAVRDFLDHPLVANVVVVSNNSADATMERAREASRSVRRARTRLWPLCLPLPERGSAARRGSAYCFVRRRSDVSCLRSRQVSGLRTPRRYRSTDSRYRWSNSEITHDPA